MNFLHKGQKKEGLMCDQKSQSKIDSLSEEILKATKRLMIFNLFPCVEHLLILDIDGTLISQEKKCISR